MRKAATDGRSGLKKVRKCSWLASTAATRNAEGSEYHNPCIPRVVEEVELEGMGERSRDVRRIFSCQLERLPQGLQSFLTSSHKSAANAVESVDHHCLRRFLGALKPHVGAPVVEEAR